MTEWPTRTTASGVLVVCPTGRLNMVAAPELREQLHQLVREGNTRLVVALRVSTPSTPRDSAR